MTEAAVDRLERLFQDWRRGDRDAGQAMARIVSDWYYAVIAVRLGDAAGREALDRACNRFVQGVVQVDRPDELVDWAHGLLDEELRGRATPAPDDRGTNALLDGRAAGDLLREAARALPSPLVGLLARLYDPALTVDDVIAAAEEAGGMPRALLQARYRLKRWLRDEAGVAFTVVPADPDLDNAPLPLYEAGRLAEEGERTAFEKWLLSDDDLCRDVAEFAVFAHALRAGAFREAAVPPPPLPERAEAPAPAPAPVPAEDVETPRWVTWAAVAGVVLVLVLIVYLFLFVLP